MKKLLLKRQQCHEHICVRFRARHDLCRFDRLKHGIWVFVVRGGGGIQLHHFLSILTRTPTIIPNIGAVIQARDGQSQH